MQATRSRASPVSRRVPAGPQCVSDPLAASGTAEEALVADRVRGHGADATSRRTRVSVSTIGPMSAAGSPPCVARKSPTGLPELRP